MKKESQEKIKKPFYKKWWFWTIIIFYVIGSIGRLITSEDSKSVPISAIKSDTIPKPTETAKITSIPTTTSKPVVDNEPKAQKLLDEAQTAFDKADYEGMLKKCDKILNDYPETAVALTVPDFIIGLRESLEKVNAVDIAKEFKENEVRASTKYKDKLIIITGIIDNIGITMGDTFVKLSDGEKYSLSQIHCWIKNAQEIEKVADLEKDDTITIIGKCSGEVVMGVSINNCFILD